MTIPLSFLGTIIGGFIAGAVGMFSTYLSRRMDRRERHLNEHHDNLKIIDKALVELMNEVWPFHYGAEEVKLGNPEFIHGTRQPMHGILGFLLVKQLKNDNAMEVTGVDRVLFGDLENHFHDLAGALYYFDKSIQSEGEELIVKTQQVTEKIYSAMYASDFQVLRWPYESAIKTLIRDIRGSMEEQDYGGIILNFLIGTDEEYWPNKIRSLKKYDLYDGLKNIADSVRTQVNETMERMLYLKDHLDGQISHGQELIEEEERNLKLRGNCRLI